MDEDETHTYDGDPEAFAQMLLEQVASGTMDSIDAAAVLIEHVRPGGTKDITGEYRTALVAHGYEEIAMALDGVTIRLGLSMVGIGYKIRKDQETVDLNMLDETARHVMSQCVIDVLRAHGVDAQQGEDGHIVFDGHTCDDPTHDHGTKRKRSLKPDFQQTIDSFVHEMDEEFGPSIPEPGASRWDRWM